MSTASAPAEIQHRCAKCGLPGASSETITCVRCSYWYHGTCGGGRENVLDGSWVCAPCVVSGSGRSTRSDSSSRSLRIKVELLKLDEEKQVREKRLQEKHEQERRAWKEKEELDKEYLDRKYSLILADTIEGDDCTTTSSSSIYHHKGPLRMGTVLFTSMPGNTHHPNFTVPLEVGLNELGLTNQGSFTVFIPAQTSTPGPGQVSMEICTPAVHQPVVETGLSEPITTTTIGNLAVVDQRAPSGQIPVAPSTQPVGNATVPPTVRFSAPLPVASNVLPPQPAGASSVPPTANQFFVQAAAIGQMPFVSSAQLVGTDTLLPAARFSAPQQAASNVLPLQTAEASIVPPAANQIPFVLNTQPVGSATAAPLSPHPSASDVLLPQPAGASYLPPAANQVPRQTSAIGPIQFVPSTQPVENATVPPIVRFSAPLSVASNVLPPQPAGALSVPTATNQFFEQTPASREFVSSTQPVGNATSAPTALFSAPIPAASNVLQPNRASGQTSATGPIQFVPSTQPFGTAAVPPTVRFSAPLPAASKVLPPQPAGASFMSSAASQFLPETAAAGQILFVSSTQPVGTTSVPPAERFGAPGKLGSPSIFYQDRFQQQMAARQVVPMELPIFTGNPEDWPLFISSYHHSTEMCGFTDAENLIRLQNCLQGFARETVQSNLLLPSTVPQVLETLEMIFGNPARLIQSLLEKVKSTPSPKADRLETLISFGVVVKNLVGHLKGANQQAHLMNPSLLRDLENKLPANICLDL
ncbi:BRD4-interacting chromatin-remodeling complex-associated protein-like [Culex pipiens pallens]|uniref:BRD4-interacting chromatin-remodeling complex-associated protein-like n=1 Tax=Culex pipiens pallens TaxID=42434 RepID=UPI0022AB4871|nr:BRD4-interacting chromatin-remodeling complex-associated protein-like [Culex pipiens pallens]